MSEPKLTRRPIRARDTRWAAAIARFLGRIGLRPNSISLLSVVFALLAGAGLVATSMASLRIVPWLFLGAAISIQLRLLCNMFDGMVAVEGGFKTKSGEIYNELPDRFSDALVLAGAGYSIGMSPMLTGLGWASALAAVITAYVRTLGASAGTAQYFTGPMAKQQRMMIVTFACVVSAVWVWVGRTQSFIAPALILILAGCFITMARRCLRIIRELEAQ